MCFNCEHSNRTNINYMCEYRCKIKNNNISEIVDTYFNTREMIIECLLINAKEDI